jgi:hypothetical protein
MTPRRALSTFCEEDVWYDSAIRDDPHPDEDLLRKTAEPLPPLALLTRLIVT